MDKNKDSVYGECPKHKGYSMIACVICKLDEKVKIPTKLEAITDQYPDIEFLSADGFEDAIIGVSYNVEKLVYSISKCIRILVDRDHMSPDEAREHFDFNVGDSFMGEKTPIWVEDEVLDYYF